MFVRDNLTSVNCCSWGIRGGLVQEMAREGILLVGKGLLRLGRVVIPRLLEEELFWGAWQQNLWGQVVETRLERVHSCVHSMVDVRWRIGDVVESDGGTRDGVGKVGRERVVDDDVQKRGREGGTRYGKQSFNFGQSGGSLTHIFTSFTLNNSIFERTKKR